MEYKQYNKRQIIRWSKRLLAIIAIVMWGYMIQAIFKLPLPFNEQAPYCIGGTMLIFGLLTLTYKLLEYWEQKNM
jgi:putative effector of murein hydrolase LrgA (UPF0299 family)